MAGLSVVIPTLDEASRCRIVRLLVARAVVIDTLILSPDLRLSAGRPRRPGIGYQPRMVAVVEST